MAEVAMLRLRTHSAETALYSIEQTLRENLLANFLQPIIRNMHDIAKRFPIGDESVDGAKEIALAAIRAQKPELAGLSDDQLLDRFFKKITI
jgi:hypothetical protein